MTRSAQALLGLVAIAAVVAGAACIDGKAAGTAAAADAPDSERVVGRVGDRTFTLEEVDRAAMRANLQAFQQIYDVRRQALETLIEEELLARAAAAQGVTVDELVAKEIDGHTQPVGAATAPTASTPR